MSVQCSETYIQFCPIMSRWSRSGFQMSASEQGLGGQVAAFHRPWQMPQLGLSGPGATVTSDLDQSRWTRTGHRPSPRPRSPARFPILQASIGKLRLMRLAQLGAQVAFMLTTLPIYRAKFKPVPRTRSIPCPGPGARGPARHGGRAPGA